MENIESIAKVCHEANRAYCQSLGDFSQAPWDTAPRWQQESAINGVRFRVQNPEVTPEGMHENWANEKRALGWKFGPVKEPEQKLHPCLVPYSELPEPQKRKDVLFSAIVAALHT